MLTPPFCLSEAYASPLASGETAPESFGKGHGCRLSKAFIDEFQCDNIVTRVESWALSRSSEHCLQFHETRQLSYINPLLFLPNYDFLSLFPHLRSLSFSHLFVFSFTLPKPFPEPKRFKWPFSSSLRIRQPSNLNFCCGGIPLPSRGWISLACAEAFSRIPWGFDRQEMVFWHTGYRGLWRYFTIRVAKL